MIPIGRLRAEHREIEEMTAQLSRIISAPIPDAAAVASMRWRMSAALTDHCAFEDHAVYDRMLASGDAAAMALAWQARQSLGGIAAQFRSYVADWPVDRIARDWGGFRAVTAALLDSLTARRTLEEKTIFPEAERVTARRAA